MRISTLEGVDRGMCIGTNLEATGKRRPEDVEIAEGNEEDGEGLQVRYGTCADV